MYLPSIVSRSVLNSDLLNGLGMRLVLFKVQAAKILNSIYTISSTILEA